MTAGSLNLRRSVRATSRINWPRMIGIAVELIAGAITGALLVLAVIYLWIAP